MTELTQLRSCNYTPSVSNLGELTGKNPYSQLGNTGLLTTTTSPQFTTVADYRNVDNSIRYPNAVPQQHQIQVTEMPNTTRRVVQIFIADTDENVPLEKSLLYQSPDPFFTDLTDQELFFELDIKKILDSHNEYRVTVKDKDKSTKDNPEFLEKAKVRDLKMTVVNVATF